MELLDSRQIRAFQELARQGSFTETARSLNLTQSAVSHSIKALETMLGVSLFDRLGKSVQLTRAGEILLPHVDQVLCGMQLAQEELLNLKLPGHGRLRIGSTVTLSQYVIPSVLREMRESFPAYEFSVITEDTQNLMDLLSSGSLDLVIGLESRRTNRSRFTPLFQDEISLAVSPLHPFASKSDLHETDLSGQTYIFYGQNSETYQQVSKYFQDRKIDYQTPLHMGSMTAIKEMAKIGMGIGLISPWMAEAELRTGTLVIRSLPGVPLQRKWGILTDSQRAVRFVETVFYRICVNVMETLQVRTERLWHKAADPALM